LGASPALEKRTATPVSLSCGVLSDEGMGQVHSTETLCEIGIV
jgi:hypothetical protein